MIIQTPDDFHTPKLEKQRHRHDGSNGITFKMGSRVLQKEWQYPIEKRVLNRVYQILSSRTNISLCNDLNGSGSPIKQNGTAFALLSY